LPDFLLRFAGEVFFYRFFGEFIMRFCSILFVVAIGFGMIASQGRADTVTLTLDKVVATFAFGPSPALPPVGSTVPGYASATFTQSTTNLNSVTLDLHAPQLGSGNVVSWGFNSSVAVSHLTIDAANPATVLMFAPPPTPGYEFFLPFSSPIFNFGLTFNNGSFVQGSPDAVFTITSNAGALTAENFNLVISSSQGYSSEIEVVEPDAGIFNAQNGTTLGGSIIGSSTSIAIPNPPGVNAGLALLGALGFWKFGQKVTRSLQTA
jgi:hypothetical protein